MDDPTLEEEPETTDDDVRAEIERMRDQFFARWGTNIRGACEEGARIADALGVRVIRSEDDPLHPKNVNRRQEEAGYFWPPRHPQAR
jgi:hypothetical protein